MYTKFFKQTKQLKEDMCLRNIKLMKIAEIVAGSIILALGNEKNKKDYVLLSGMLLEMQKSGFETNIDQIITFIENALNLKEPEIKNRNNDMKSLIDPKTICFCILNAINQIPEEKISKDDLPKLDAFRTYLTDDLKKIFTDDLKKSVDKVLMQVNDIDVIKEAVESALRGHFITIYFAANNDLRQCEKDLLEIRNSSIPQSNLISPFI